jgi:endonuclease YncB( thermonuclease family)
MIWGLNFSGLATVRKEGKNDVSSLAELEEAAKSANKGKWGPDSPEVFSSFKHYKFIFA